MTSNVNGSHNRGNIHNFFFHPLNSKKAPIKTASIITNIFLTAVTFGIWQIPFWIVNRLDHKKIKQVPKENANKTHTIATIGLGTETQKIPDIAFGKAKWEEYYGDIGVEPPLPENIDEILNSACPFFEGKTIKDTHILVLVPATVNNRETSLENLHKDILPELKKGPPKKRTKLLQNRIFIPYNSSIDRQKTVSESHWVLMTKECIPKSTNKTRKEQTSMLSSIKIAEKNYEPLSFLDATVSIAMHYSSTGECLFPPIKGGGGFPHVNATRCQDGYTVGPFATTPYLSIIMSAHDSDYIPIPGIAAMVRV